MGSTLLSLVQAAEAELGLFPVPTAVVSAQDNQTQQLYALMNRVGVQVAQRREWTAFETEAIINVIAPVVTTGDIHGNSAVVDNIVSTAGIVAGTWVVQGNSIPQAARVLSVDSASQITMTELATAAAANSTITFSQDTYAMPTDFRHFINRTQWDRSNRWELRGPTSPQEWEWIISGIVSTGPRRHFRQFGTNIRLWPPPTTLDSPATLAYEYISTGWATSALGVRQTTFLADTDTCIFPDDVMITGLKAAFYKAKGFDSSDLVRDFERALSIAMAQEGGAPTLDMVNRRWPIFISPANVPDTGFGVP